jgi:hypothetical protein
MSKILTAEEFLIDWMGIDNSTHPNIDSKNQWLERKNQLIKFAKLHCEAQLKAIVINAEQKQVPYTEDYEIDYNSIINAYPLTNIK